MKTNSLINSVGKGVIAVAIAVFSMLLFCPKVEARSKYADFDFDTFVSEYGSYWQSCFDDESCGKILKKQKYFYENLFENLTRYEKQGIYINYELIIAVLFYESDITDITDDGEDYKKNWKQKENNWLYKEVTDLFGSKEENSEEEDIGTINYLIKNMLRFEGYCYGVKGEANTTGDGSVCPNGGEVFTNNGTSYCGTKLKTYNINYKEYLKTRHSDFEFKTSPIKMYSEKYSLNKYLTDCKKNTGYDDYIFVYDDSNELEEKEVLDGKEIEKNELVSVSDQKFFEFLIEDDFFDSRIQYQHYFYDDVLKPANVSCLKTSLCNNSLESKNLYDDYENSIKKVKKRIVNYIIQDIKKMGIDVDYTDYDTEYSKKSSKSISYYFYFPIGSDIETSSNGTLMASKEPKEFEINNNYYPFNERYGIDITTTEEGNIIAAYSGTVIEVDNSSVTIEHSNSLYTYYSNLSCVNESITVGTKVAKGQVIGTINSKDAGGYLHYEIRNGGNSVENAVNPMTFIDLSNLRPIHYDGDSGVSRKGDVCNYLKELGYPDEAIAAILVNMNAESGIVTNNLENGSNMSSGLTDQEFTDQVDSGIITREEFLESNVFGIETYGNPKTYGYGLSQWTSVGRKGGLYNLMEERGVSIADLVLQVDYVDMELKSSSYSQVYNVLMDPSKTVFDKTNIYCQVYEVPYDFGNYCPSKRAPLGDAMLSYVKNDCS